MCTVYRSFSGLCLLLVALAVVALTGCDKSTPASEQQAEPKGGFYGYFSRNAVRMDILDYHQVWDAQQNKLTLLFTPAPLTAADRENLEKNKNFMLGAFSSTASPDPARWASWYPLVLVEFHFAGPEVSLDTLKHYQVVASRIELPEYTESFGGMPDTQIRIDQLDFVSGRLVGLHFSGSKSFYLDSPYEAHEQWQIIVH